jgi:ribose transport system substrate-binding protein
MGGIAMKKIFAILIVASVCVGLTGTMAVTQERDWARSILWNPYQQEMVDCSKYKKNPPYTMAYCNASLSNAWAVVGVQAIKYVVNQNKDKIKDFVFTDAMDKPDKQIADMEDLMAKGVDLIVIRAITEAALDPIVTRAHTQGIPVICFSRKVKSDNFVSFVSASNYTMGRAMAIWLAQYLKGKGNIVLLAGVAGAGSAEERLIGIQEVLPAYPGINVLEKQYTQYSTAKGKQVMQAMIQSYGKKINGVLSVGGAEAVGAIEALHEAGMKVPITGEPYNGFMKRVQQFGFPALAVDFSPAMAGECVTLGTKVLQGIAVPKYYQGKRYFITTHNTEDIKSDLPWKNATFPDRPDTFVFGSGLPPAEWLK